MILFFKFIAILIIAVLIPTAFNPKYRYNEHCKWEPELIDLVFMWVLGMFLIGIIIL